MTAASTTKATAAAAAAAATGGPETSLSHPIKKCEGPDCDRHSSGLRDTTHLHAEHDIGKLKVLQSSNDTMAKKYAMSVMAASVAETVTYPLDLTKTRLQLQGEIAAGEVHLKYRGMLGTAFGIVKEEGLLMLWRGMLPALYRHAIYTGIRMSAYEEVRNNLQRHNKDGFPVWKKVVAGMTAGGVGQLVASPTDLIKTQIQMEGRRRLQGKPARVKGSWDALTYGFFSRETATQKLTCRLLQ